MGAHDERAARVDGREERVAVFYAVLELVAQRDCFADYPFEVAVLLNASTRFVSTFVSPWFRFLGWGGGGFICVRATRLLCDGAHPGIWGARRQWTFFLSSCRGTPLLWENGRVSQTKTKMVEVEDVEVWWTSRGGGGSQCLPIRTTYGVEYEDIERKDKHDNRKV